LHNVVLYLVPEDTGSEHNFIMYVAQCYTVCYTNYLLSRLACSCEI